MSGIVIKGMMHRFQWQKSYVREKKKKMRRLVMIIINSAENYTISIRLLMCKRAPRGSVTCGYEVK